MKTEIVGEFAHVEVELFDFYALDELFLEVIDSSGEKDIHAVAILDREQVAALILALQTSIARMPR